MAAILLAAFVAGCGGKDEPKALAENLAQLGYKARADTEALGLPADVGFKVMRPTSRIGLAFASDVKTLKGTNAAEKDTNAAEKEQIASLAEGFRFYYNELAAAVKLYEAGHPEVYAVTLDRAKPSLETAEQLATRMGAPECAVRRFPDR